MVIEAKLMRQTRSQATIRLSVRDSGIGIPEDRQEAIFESFTQADGSTTRRYGGTGLGLTICRQLVDLMNGRIGLESEEGKGSVFWLELDLLKQAHTSKKAVAKKSLECMRVLVVDDNQTNRTILCEQLKSWGCVPTQACSGTEALEIASQTDPFGLVITDLHMPKLDGDATTKQLKQMEGYDQTPVVLLTSVCSRNVEAKHLYAATLTKPARQAQLLSTLLRVTGNDEEVEEHGGEPARRVSGKENSCKDVRILVAEDNMVNQKLLSHLLRRCGCQVTMTSNGQQALDAFKVASFDLVLMDVQMPVMDGFESTMLIRELESARARKVPIVAITAHAMEGDREKCLEAGMDDYLTKPIKHESLIAIIEKWITNETAQSHFKAPMFNFDALARSCEGDHQLEVELLNLFLQSGQASLEKLDAAVKVEDAGLVVQEAHCLKGSCLALGAEELAEICANLEAIGRSGDLGAAAFLTLSARRKFENLCMVLRDHMSKVA